MSASSGSRAAVQQILDALDPAVVPDVLARYGRTPSFAWPSGQQQLVLVGHRATGKSRLLPLIAQLTGRPAVDLDEAIAARAGRPLIDWVREDMASFRRAERETFEAQPPGQLIAAGGGFLALHADLLAPHVAVLIPVSFETYCARLSADTTRPRLRPELTLEEELRAVFFEREALHLRASTVPLGEFLRAAVERAA